MHSRFLIIFIIAIFISGCEKRASTPVKIGLIGDFRDDVTTMGLDGLRGAQLAIDDINKAGGVKGREFILFQYNHSGDKKTAYNMTKEMIAKNFPLIIGPYRSEIANSVIAAARLTNTLVLSPTVSNDDLTGIDDHFVRLSPTAAKEGRVLGNSIINNNYKSLLIIMERSNSKYGNSISKSIKEFTYEDRVQINIIYTSGRVSINELKRNINVHSVLFITEGKLAVNYIKEINKLKKTPQLYASIWTRSTRILELGGDLVEGLITSDFFRSIEGEEKIQHFETNFMQIYNRAPTVAACYSYEAIYILKDIVAEYGTLDLPDLKEKIIYKDKIEGLYENFKFNSYGDIIREYSLYQIINGSYSLCSN